MSDSETAETTEPAAEQPITRELLDRLGEQIVTRTGVPIINGPATIRLILRSPDAATPLSAVDDAMLDMARNGLNEYAWLVTDEATDESWWVFDGRIVTAEELTGEAGDDDDDEDDELAESGD